MVLVNIKSTNGTKAKAASFKRHQVSVTKARSTIRAGQRGIVRTSGYYGAFPQGRTAVGGEMKFHDLDIDDATIAIGGTIVALSVNLIGQGVEENKRVGRKCTIRSINWRYQISMAAAGNASNTNDIIRVIVYLDKQCNGATATVTGILEADDFQSFNNLANKNRFVILMDKTHKINATCGSGRGSTDTLAFGEYSENFSFYKKCNFPIEFDSTSGAITEIRSNNIGVMLLAKDGVCTFGSKMRLRFSDN